ncbi:MBL fold metallo-hydrolase [Salinarimonas soli]|uniref:MBL fold metallo-hydrolase n=1 Tax=Salinarimonas soli TaxID=1638099 RepID=A0A5B2VCU4_9HYPH|nr:MBL fold metallo-hydrolase [Salinarimonas soli]KAA2236881.1 MBL fold metallo-hydrolase [Salinarimonas soli]
MRIHHLNCGCMCPVGGALFDGFSKGISSHLVCHCLAIEAGEGLVLVDTGFGMGDMRNPERLSAFFRAFNRIQFDPQYTAIHRLRELGFGPRDVRHIVLTHLDFDHAGGLEDFPEATVHVLQAEKDAAEAQAGFIARNRYARAQWDDVRRWRFYDRTRGDRWNGFEAVRDLDGLPPEILVLPLPGHTRGHAGVAIDTGRDWLLNAGDAYFFRKEMNPEPSCTPGLRFYQTMMEVDRPARLANQERLRALANRPGAGVRIFCSHDAVEYEALARPPR